MLSKELLTELQEYVDLHLETLHFAASECSINSRVFQCERAEQIDMANFIINNKKPSFCKILFGYIDKSDVSDVEIYKKAGIDRRHFSKIRSNPDYHPGKNTAVALALALELDRKEADKLLNSAGYTLSDSETFDLVITFCLERKIYSLQEVNLALDYFSLKPLTGVIE